jgi:dethiobiotin synthetase
MTTWNTNTINTTTGYNSNIGNYTMSNLNSSNDAVLTVNTGSDASLEVKGSIVMNGRNLEERLTTIEDILMIPERDVELENRYPKLKTMYDAYIKELSKYRMWEEIKK